MQIAGIFPFCLTNLARQRTETMPSGVIDAEGAQVADPSVDGHLLSSFAVLTAENESVSILFVTKCIFYCVFFFLQSDASVEKRGFRASWKTEPQTCGGDLVATSQAQVLASPNYPEPYPGGLECVYTITTTPGKIITLEVNKK